MEEIKSKAAAKHSYEIIVLDLDGTLTNRDKIITPRTNRALMEAQERGKKIVLASGRPTCGVMPLAKELELERFGGYILSFNGGVITDCGSGEILFGRLLPLEGNQKIVALAEKEQVGVVSYSEDYKTLLTNHSESPYARLEQTINHMDIQQVDDMAARITYQVPKFLMVEDGDYLAMVEPRVKAALGKNYSVYRSEPYFLEILPRGIDKGQSLERLLSLIGLKREQMIACGDGYNDLTMIQYAGLGVAMANAVLPARKAADYITLSNDEDGVAHVVEKFMLRD